MKLGWKNNEIDKLLESDKVNLLRGCRNDTFHYQKKYFPNRYIKFISEADSVTWIKSVNAYFGKFFLEEFEKEEVSRMEDGEFKIGPSSKEELKKDLKDMMVQLWWVWLTLVPILVVGLIVVWKFRSAILSRLGF